MQSIKCEFFVIKYEENDVFFDGRGRIPELMQEYLSIIRFIT